MPIGSWLDFYRTSLFGRRRRNYCVAVHVDRREKVLQEWLKTCASFKLIYEGQEVHSEIVKEGFETDPFVGTALVDMYAKCGLLVEAREVFDALPRRDVVLWTALIAGYSEQGLYQNVLACLEQMQLEGSSPNAVTYLCTLKSFISAGAIDSGYTSHAALLKYGFEQDLYLGSGLIDFYAKCGLLLEAHAVLKKIAIRNAFSWNALIMAYADNMLGEEVLILVEQMQQEDVTPDGVTYVCSLKGCGLAGDKDRGHSVHTEIAKCGLESSFAVGNSLIDMYAKCNAFAEAEDIFGKLPDHNAVSWTTLITGYVEHGYNEKALVCFDDMQLKGIPPDAVTFIGSLKAISSLKDTSKGQRLHFEIIKEELETDLLVCNSLIDFYAQCSLFVEALDLLETLPARDSITWNSVIAGLIEHGLAEEAYTCLERMQTDCLSPDSVTFMCSLKACIWIGNICRGQELHTEIAKRGYDSDSFVGNTLVDMYAKSGLLLDACNLFKQLQVQDVATWTACISGHAENGYGGEALNWFKEMQAKGVSPNIATFVSCLKACSSIRAIQAGIAMYDEITQKGLETCASIGSSLVDMYAKCGLLSEAHAIFQGLTQRDDVTFNALLWGYAECGHGVEAIKCMDQMHSEGIVPDSITFGSILKTCVLLEDLEYGEVMHCEVVKRGFERYPFIGYNMVDLYAKCGLHVEARNICNRLPKRDVISWNTLISGYVDHGAAEEALNCLGQMQIDGLPPDEVTYVACLKACGSLGTLDRGQELHASIVEQDLQNDLLICNTSVDMYAKCGSLAEARKLFDVLLHRDVISWNVMIAGYSNQGESDLAFGLLDRMIQEAVQPNGATLLSILLVSNHSGLTAQAQQYFHYLSTENACLLTVDHYNCMVDLFGRAVQLENMQKMLELMPFQPNLVTWSSTLSSYRKLGYINLEIHASYCAACLG